MERKRLELALERIAPHQWRRFEEFASEFLVADYPNLRTVASPSGDSGRDAELFSPEGRPLVVLQYSTSQDWRRKIRETLDRVTTELPDSRVLVYVTNAQIGARGDELKRHSLDNYNVVLDIHDASWFLDRASGDAGRESAAERLATDIVDPYLATKGVIKHQGLALSDEEYRAALLYLQLQWEDDTRHKGLTKLSFDALVRAALRDTDSDNRISRQEVHRRVKAMVPSQYPDRVTTLTDAALIRLNKRVVRHWTKEDEFCLAHEESARINERMTTIELEDLATNREIRGVVEDEFQDTITRVDLIDATVQVVRETVERYLWGRGETFASAVASGSLEKLVPEDVPAVLERHVRAAILPHGIEARTLVRLAKRILIEPGDAIQNRIRTLADAYTLFAFLRETGDTQAAVSKLFSFGSVWFDTSLLLPVFSEILYPANKKRFTHLLLAAHEAGMKLFVTSGVIEEIERHMNRSLAFIRMSSDEWEGRVPFLAARYLETGRPPSAFSSWLEHFRGNTFPEDDLADYLVRFHQVKLANLDQEVQAAPEDLRIAVQEMWQETHDSRRSDRAQPIDELAVSRLVKHDVENFVGVLEKRRRQERSPLGFSAWWVTLDRTAFQMEQRLRAQWGVTIKGSPAMSPDFLLNYLAIGPSRRLLPRASEENLPLVLGIGMADDISKDLLMVAKKIREEATDLPEHVVQRKVRDYLDSAKRRAGRLTQTGLDAVGEDIFDFD